MKSGCYIISQLALLGTIDSCALLHNVSIEQCRHALAHLALGRDAQLHDEEFELAIFPAKEQTMHKTSTSRDTVV